MPISHLIETGDNGLLLGQAEARLCVVIQSSQTKGVTVQGTPTNALIHYMHCRHN